MALENAGLGVVEAEDVQAALDIFRQRGDIDAVISDVAMPGTLDGIDLARVLRSARPDMPILLTTGSGEVRDLPPFVTVLAKPYRTVDLPAYLSAALPVA